MADFNEMISQIPSIEDGLRKWRKSRCGYITASNVEKLMVRGAEIKPPKPLVKPPKDAPKPEKKYQAFSDGAITYLHSIEMERYLDQPKRSVYSYALKMGNDNEAIAVEWARLHLDKDIYHHQTDFQVVKWAKYGASLDCSLRNIIIEIKTVVGDEESYAIFSPTTPYEIKKEYVLKKHYWQMVGQLLAYPKMKKIILLKYWAKWEDDEWDIRDVMDYGRGLGFEFPRSIFKDALKAAKTKIILADSYLKLGLPLNKINEYYGNTI